MAYADQTMSSRKVVSIGIVALLHVVIGYAFINGLAINVIKKVATELKTVDIKDQPPPPEQKPPPPPPEQKQVEPPPIVSPPPIIRTQTLAPPIVTVPNPPPAPVITPAAPPAPPAPKVASKGATAKGDPQSWVTEDDYPPAAARDGRGGSVGLAFTINVQGKIENCHITSSSGSPDLDETACRLVTRRGKYSPAKDDAGNAMTQTAALRFRWQPPKD